MVSILKPIPCDEFNVLYDMLEEISVPLKCDKSRGNFPIHRAMTLGITRGRYNGIIGPSYSTKKHPHIYEEIMRIGKLLGTDCQSIHVNHNVTCPKHLDSNNVGESILVSFGDYTGGNIVVEDVVYDAFCQPIKFNGSTMVHYNTDNLVGSKYSLVFFDRNGR